MALALSKRLSLKRFLKGEGSQQSLVKLNHRRIFILPSKGGLSLAIVVLLMLIASINYNNSMGFVFTFLLAAAAQTSIFFSFKNLSRLIVSQTKTPVFHAGSMGQLNINIKEPEHLDRWNITATYLDQHKTFNLHKGETLSVTLPLTFNSRGWHSLDTLTLSTTFPFGFFRAWSPILFKQPLLVYPQAIDTGLELKANQDNTEQGESPSQQSGTDDFVGLKTYQQGESFRHINWKALAAEKGLYSKEFNANQSNNIWLDWKTCHDLPLESKISQLCFWVLQCEDLGLNYGLRLPNLERPPNHGLSHQHACLKELALYGHA